MTTLAVLTNWKRAANIGPIARALLAGDIRPDRIVLVDNSPWDAPPFDADDCTDTIRVTYANLGPSCRFLAPLAFPGYDYCLLVDDDVLPHSTMLAHLLATARYLGGQFSTLGLVGRVYDYDGTKASCIKRNAGRDVEFPQAVDCTCRVHLFRTLDIQHVISFRHDLIRQFGERAKVFTGLHDDVTLCCAIQRHTRLMSYLAPIGGSYTEGEVHSFHPARRFTELPDASPASGRSTHVEERNALLKMAHTVGWRPLATRIQSTEDANC